MKTNEEDKFLTMDSHTFDQTESGWRSLEDRQRRIEAIERYLQTYAPHGTFVPNTPKTPEGTSAVGVNLLYWHLGQLNAYGDDYKKAIFYMEKSLGKDDSQWNDYVNSTIAFLNKDKEEFEKYANKENYCKNTIEKLRNNFYKSYKVASEADA